MALAAAMLAVKPSAMAPICQSEKLHCWCSHLMTSPVLFVLFVVNTCQLTICQPVTSQVKMAGRCPTLHPRVLWWLAAASPLTHACTCITYASPERCIKQEQQPALPTWPASWTGTDSYLCYLFHIMFKTCWSRNIRLPFTAKHPDVAKLVLPYGRLHCEWTMLLFSAPQ